MSDEIERPREWWIDDVSDTTDSQFDAVVYNEDPLVMVTAHVIEKSYADSLAAEVSELKQTLKYRDEDIPVLRQTINELQANLTACETRKEELIEMIFKHDSRAHVNLQDANESREKLAAAHELIERLCSALELARKDERDRIYDDLGCPGLEGCGPVTIETKYDEVLESAKAFRREGENGK